MGMEVGGKIHNYHVIRAIDYIKKNYDKPLSLDGMAKYLGLNKSYFSHLFKKETGKTYSQFVNQIRVEKSKELIVSTNLSLLDIALSVGYNNQNYYNMAFKKITGLTPLRYRNKFTYKVSNEF
ncbi:MAG: helix-turn-helix transcriptional regulator [Tissierellia bacterium]|nr:helix-turn-helix transcriptional regulator [Tissierellia bacterium]